MSYSLDGIREAGVDPAGLASWLEDAYGEAVAAIRGTPAGPIDSVLVDRRAAGWEALKEAVAGWFRDRGHPAASWAPYGDDPDRAAILELDDPE